LTLVGAQRLMTCMPSDMMMRLARCWFAGAAALLFLAIVSLARAQTFDTAAPHAILVDFDGGTVLFEKAADERIVPASMAKLMTIEYVFHRLKDGSLSLDDSFTISENAWRRGGAPSGGSAMFAELNSSIELRFLLRGLIVQSGNDAAIAIAEGIAGTEEAFAELLNRRAQDIGLTDSTFRNASGLHHPEQLVTVRDLARLARHIIREYPDYYPIFAEPEFTWNGITQSNRNPLLGEGGVDGLKTGFVKESGYGVTVSAQRGTQRLILVVAGLQSERERIAEATRLLDWGFRSFEQVTAFEADEIVAELDVYGGAVSHVPVRARGPVRILVERTARDALRARVVYQGPLIAPVQEGAEVATFTVWNGDKVIQETPLYTAQSVARGPLHRRALDALFELAFGWL
jgi:D-alanyl-D-alanine carboxypeptidase (penicillin-binding protein 5/6)